MATVVRLERPPGPIGDAPPIKSLRVVRHSFTGIAQCLNADGYLAMDGTRAVAVA